MDENLPVAGPEVWEQHRRDLMEAIAQADGWEREKYKAQLADAEKGRANAYKIAQLQSSTSRYGVDVQARTAMAQLKEQARQFDLRHGLDRAQAYTEYASTPDRFFMLGDFLHGMERAGQQMGPSPYGATGQPHMKTWEDFAALEGWGATPAVAAGRSGAAAPSAASGGGSGAQVQAQPAGGGGAGALAPPDPRIKAANAIVQAIPPSQGSGTSADDFAALNAIESVYRASLPGSFERLRPGQQKIFAAGLNRLGYYAPDAIADLRRTAPNQGNPRQAA